MNAASACTHTNRVTRKKWKGHESCNCMHNLPVYLNLTSARSLSSSPLRSRPSLMRLTRIFSLISLSCMSVHSKSTGIQATRRTPPQSTRSSDERWTGIRGGGEKHSFLWRVSSLLTLARRAPASLLLSLLPLALPVCEWAHSLCSTGACVQ